MKNLIFIIIMLTTIKPYNSFNDFENNFLYNNGVMTKDEIIESINLETRVIISDIELKIFFKKYPYKKVK